jgi:hypothetical protein
MATFVRYTYRRQGGAQGTRAINLDTVQRAEWGKSEDGSWWFCWIFASGGEGNSGYTVWERGKVAEGLAWHMRDLADNTSDTELPLPGQDQRPPAQLVESTDQDARQALDPEMGLHGLRDDDNVTF